MGAGFNVVWHPQAVGKLGHGVTQGDEDLGNDGTRVGRRGSVHKKVARSTKSHTKLEAAIGPHGQRSHAGPTPRPEGSRIGATSHRVAEKADLSSTNSSKL
ncbi:hypothetical protein M6B38_251520 [Iris pallida]|uniref:Uncharacterized protein n=1 Tax=Iris pallida TaxID=29817 RepID=A0AAX6IJG9_IRIPA|nr:hypothetical protein M6B38_251520 [Iris pallida]